MLKVKLNTGSPFIMGSYQPQNDNDPIGVSNGRSRGYRLAGMGRFARFGD